MSPSDKAPSADAERVHAGDGAPLPPLLPALLRHHAIERGEAPYVTAIARDGRQETVTYAELDDASSRFAGVLRRELDAGPGDVVALAPTNTLPSVVAIVGALRSGCGLLVLNPADPAPRLDEQAAALGARAILRPDDVTAALAEAPAGNGDPPLAPSDDALFFGTSGSTAASKLVAQSHANAAVNADAVRRHHDLRPGDRLLGCLPICHVNGVHFTLLATLASGAHALLAEGFDPLGYPRLVERFRPRLASVVPSILEALLETWRRPASPGELEYVVSAAAPLAAGTAGAVRARLGIRVLQGYGLTETTNFSTTMPRDVSADGYRRLVEEAEIPSIGIALRGGEVAVLTDDGKRAAPGEVGELCMRGPSVMSRYAHNPVATAESFRGGWFHSQDLGYAVDDSGRRFFVVTGRTKNIAKVGGESVSLDELERALRGLPGVRDAACVALPHRFLGDEIVAAVVLAPVPGDVDLRTPLQAVLPPNALPRRFVELAAIPRTATGKIRRTVLAAGLASERELVGGPVDVRRAGVEP